MRSWKRQLRVSSYVPPPVPSSRSKSNRWWVFEIRVSFTVSMASPGIQPADFTAQSSHSGMRELLPAQLRFQLLADVRWQVLQPLDGLPPALRLGNLLEQLHARLQTLPGPFVDCIGQAVRGAAQVDVLLVPHILPELHRMGLPIL